jgi:serine/threonine protein kinase
MGETPGPELLLRPGSLVGSWCVVGYAGRGTYGAVYRARRAGESNAPLVALKVAVFPKDPRFLRERELLSRSHHPAIPQLLDWGWWSAGPEASYPYLVLEWVRGLPLYEWARVHPVTQRQVLGVVEQVAGALAELHLGESLHRDVKGDNLLVEPAGWAHLMDFGSGTWKGAPPLTESLMPPNTTASGPRSVKWETWKVA